MQFRTHFNVAIWFICKYFRCKSYLAFANGTPRETDSPDSCLLRCTTDRNMNCVSEIAQCVLLFRWVNLVATFTVNCKSSSIRNRTFLSSSAIQLHQITFRMRVWQSFTHSLPELTSRDLGLLQSVWWSTSHYFVKSSVSGGISTFSPYYFFSTI